MLAKALENQKVDFSLSALFHSKTRASLKNLVTGSLWKTFFCSNLPQTSLNLISLSISVILMPFTLF